MHPLVVATPTAGSRRPLQLSPGTGADLGADAAYSDSSNVSEEGADIWGSAGAANGSTSSSPSVWDLPKDFVLYRSYTIRFVPLRPPEQLSLRAITFSNNVSVVIACGVPAAYEHLFVLPKRHSAVAATGAVRPSSIMSSNYAAASSQAPGKRANSSSASHTAAGGADGSSFTQLSADAAAATDQVAASSSSDDSAGPPASLTAAPGVDVQIAYLLMRPPGSNGTSMAQDVAAAAKVPNRLRMQQFSVYDRASNRSVLWSRFTAAECAQDHYILLPMAQLKPDMRMVPELVDPEGFVAGVKIAMSAAAVALPGALDSNNSSSSTGSSTGSSSTGSSVSHLGVPSEGSSSVSSWLLGQKFQGGSYGSGNAVAAAAATAAVDGGKGFGGAGQNNLGDQVWCNSNSSSGVRTGVTQSAGSISSTNADSSDADCRLQLPGLTAELPIILTADEGRSSRTYTMLLYSNVTAATAVHDMVLPQEAAAGGGRAGSSSSGSQAADAAALTAAYFAGRPGHWPRSPAQSSMCNVCPNGTYSTRTDAVECKVRSGPACQGRVWCNAC
jgi:hypothetical protein